MPITLNNVVGNNAPLYKGIYPKRPIWGVYSGGTGTAPSATNGFFYTFSDNPYVFQSMDYNPGSSQANVGMGRNRLTNADEVVSSGGYFAPSAGTQTSSENYSPVSGYVGVPYVCQTGSLANFYAYDNGNWGHAYHSANTSSAIHRYAGVIIGESTWNQTFGFCAYNGKLMKVPLGIFDNIITTPATNNDFFWANSAIRTGSNWSITSGSGLGLGDATLTSAGSTIYNDSSAYRNNGMLCHNRNNTKLAYLEGTTSTGQFKLHIINLQNKIGQNTTNSQILSWITTAVAGGTSLYNVYTITLPSWSNAYTGGQSMQQLKPILCDDGTMWIVGWDHTNGSSGTLRLYKCTDTAAYATWTQVSTMGQTTSYDSGSGNYYGIRHMNSDDNSRVAVYVPYYYYHGGIHAFIVDTRTAVTSGTDVKWCQFAQSDSNGGYFIVPTGGPNFSIHQTYNNADGGSGAQWMQLSLSTLIGDSKTYTLTANYQPTYNQSTSYQGWLPVKVLPTDEWKPSF
jgi:hypothetical protein